MNEFEIAFFTDNLFRPVCSVGSDDFFSAFCTYSFVECSGISRFEPLDMSLVWMARREREVILDIKCEFLADNFKRFFGYLTLDNTSKESVDIFLCCLVANFPLVILFDWKWWIIWSMVRWSFLIAFPVPSFLNYIFLRHWEVFLSYRFVITERGERMREKFTPLSCRNHMFDDFTSQWFIFLNRVIFIKNTVVLFSETNTSETILWVIAELCVVEKRIIISERAEARKFHSITGMCFILLLAFKSRFIRVVTVFHCDILETVFEILTFQSFKTVKYIFWVIYEISECIFWKIDDEIFFDSFILKL